MFGAIKSAFRKHNDAKMVALINSVRSTLRSELQAELSQHLAGSRDEIMARVASLLTLRQVNESGVPNLSELNMALRNITAAHLSIKYFGYDLGRKLASALPVRRDTKAHDIEIKTSLSIQRDMESDWVAHWCGQLRVPLLYHRKLWELSYVLQAVHQHGFIRAGACGLGFACGEEPIASYLASQGVKVTVTDLDYDRAAAGGWVHTGQHTANLEKAFVEDLVDRSTFNRLVSFEHVDMNAIPSHLVDYDFCWSICSLEHLGSIDLGLNFIENSLKTLRPGGISIHTTEFNIDPHGPTIDNWPTVLFQARHIEQIAERLRLQGHEVTPIDFDLGDGPMDRFIDVPPWIHDTAEEHKVWHGKPQVLKLALDGFVATCVGLVVRKAQ